MNLPNVITVTRILLIPVFIVLYMLQRLEYFALACCLLSRRYRLVGWLSGSSLNRPPWRVFRSGGRQAHRRRRVDRFGVLPQQPLVDSAVVIVGREIVISALREWMAEVNDSVAVAVSYLGKIKTTLQMIALTLLLSQPVGADSVAFKQATYCCMRRR